MSEFLSVCPLDCYDSCSFIVKVEDKKITKIAGNPNHPITKGFICKKGQKLLDRQYSFERITTPLLKVNESWQRISWEEAIDLLAEKIAKVIDEHGSKAILDLHDGGSSGLLRDAGSMFFNNLGPITGVEGSLCWGAGKEAQKCDFGGLFSHSWSDLLNANTIILWGRNPVATNIHLVPFLKEAQQQGAKIISVSSIRTKTAELSDIHVAPKPGTDGALALGIAHTILSNGWIDSEFVASYVEGFEDYVHLVKKYNPERVSNITGVDVETIEGVAKLYAYNKPSAILFGYGVQRYQNGGRTVRAINSLAAITGNIGVKGGGVNYAHQYWLGLLNRFEDQNTQKNRALLYPKLASEILTSEEPNIKLMFISRANPVCQLPNTSKVLEAFNKVDYKVVMDFYLTDTAEVCDLFLPVTTSFESEDIVASSWSDYLQYAPKLIPARGEAKSELEIFNLLAERLQLKSYPIKTSTEWIKEIIKPLSDYGITLEKLQEKGFIKNPIITGVAWEGKLFNTPSGKFQLCADEYVAPMEIGDDTLAKEYPFVLISPHKAEQMHSQHFNLLETEKTYNLPLVELNPEDGIKLYIRTYDKVLVESPRGSIEALAILTSEVSQGTIVIYEGYWHKEAKGVNFLTPDLESDIGKNASYYDCRCAVRKYMID